MRSTNSARSEGLEIYTVALFGPNGSVLQASKDHLIACSDSKLTPDTQHENYYFRASDLDSLKDAFNAVARVRRTG